MDILFPFSFGSPTILTAPARNAALCSGFEPSTGKTWQGEQDIAIPLEAVDGSVVFGFAHLDATTERVHGLGARAARRDASTSGFRPRTNGLRRHVRPMSRAQLGSDRNLRRFEPVDKANPPSAARPGARRRTENRRIDRRWLGREPAASLQATNGAPPTNRSVLLTPIKVTERRSS
jgi:hypothetical protein